MQDSAVHPYASTAYAEVQSELPPLVLPEWRGFVLRRLIEGGGVDATGPYPMTVLTPAADIEGGLERCRNAGIVSVVLVPDPLTLTSARLVAAFPIFRPFKTHFLIDPAVSPFAPSKHHRDRIRRGNRRCRIEQTPLAERFADWCALYSGVVDRRGVTGLARFSEAYFRMLAAEPAVKAFAAFVGEECVAMTLWFAFGGVVYNHLTASNASGNANGANFALYGAAIDHFAGQGVVNLGGGAGFVDGEDGLTAFKRGFANGQVMANLCGAVLDPSTYARLSGRRSDDGFFPAYRGPSASQEGIRDPVHVR